MPDIRNAAGRKVGLLAAGLVLAGTLGGCNLMMPPVAATDGPCGIWVDNIYQPFGGTGAYSEFGCSTRANLEAMVVDPADLAGPAGAEGE